MNEKCSTLMGDIFFFSGSTGTVGAWINDMKDSLMCSAHNDKFNATLGLNNMGQTPDDAPFTSFRAPLQSNGLLRIRRMVIHNARVVKCPQEKLERNPFLKGMPRTSTGNKVQVVEKRRFHTDTSKTDGQVVSINAID
jgi:hypothetical protein